LIVSEESPSRDILLIAADLGERRLLNGELLEAGYDVLPVPGMALALGRLLKHAVEPRLVLLDVREDPEATPQSVRYLLTLIPGIPLILVVGSINRDLWEPIADQVAAMLVRPVTIGKIIEAVQRILPAPPRAE
jgi:DNA-binding NtrC family response regulator